MFEPNLTDLRLRLNTAKRFRSAEKKIMTDLMHEYTTEKTAEKDKSGQGSPFSFANASFPTLPL
jgi:hypothetical protein